MRELKASLDCERGSRKRVVLEKKRSAQKDLEKVYTVQCRYIFAYHFKLVSVDAALDCVNTEQTITLNSTVYIETNTPPNSFHQLIHIQNTSQILIIWALLSLFSSFHKLLHSHLTKPPEEKAFVWNAKSAAAINLFSPSLWWGLRCPEQREWRGELWTTWAY